MMGGMNDREVALQQRAIDRTPVRRWNRLATAFAWRPGEQPEWMTPAQLRVFWRQVAEADQWDELDRSWAAVKEEVASIVPRFGNGLRSIMGRLRR